MVNIVFVQYIESIHFGFHLVYIARRNAVIQNRGGIVWCKGFDYILVCVAEIHYKGFLLVWRTDAVKTR